MIKKDIVEYRDYQVNISHTCIAENTLIVLPTGLGKTVIALIVIAEILKCKGGKVLFMAPTKPLVEQHAAFLRKFLIPQDIIIFTGEVAPAVRNVMWKNSNIIVSTPQVISNDILADRINLKEVSLIVFDEAHRAVGDYAYVFIGETYKKRNGRVLAMTASPGSNTEKITSVCDNLGIVAMELRTEYDADVVNYTHRISINLVEVEMTENAREMGRILRTLLDEKKKELQKHGFALSPKPLNMRELLAINATIREKLHSGLKQPSYFHAITLAAMAMKINQALEYIETQSVGALRNYIERLEIDANSKGASKATKTLIADERIRHIVRLAREVQPEHPKILKVAELVGRILIARKDSRIIVFTHYRDISDLVLRQLERVPGAHPVRFVGQTTKGDDIGMKQKEQAGVLQKFRDGEYNILVATSVAEEGLDIPSTDFVIFYEPVPSEIRSIQRRGRTGRIQSGRAYILVTKGTRDVPYFWSSVGKEKKMKQIIALKNQLRGRLSINTLSAPIQEATCRNNLMPPTDKLIESPEVTAPTINKKQVEIIDEKMQDKERIKNGDMVHSSDETDFIQRTSIQQSESQRTLLEFGSEKKQEKESIIVDSRELNSEVARELSRLDFRLETVQLEVGDYVLSDRVAIERKEVADFLQSIIDGRLFEQVNALRRAYLRPLVVIEGDGLFTTRNFSENAIYGALASMTVDYGIPVIFTKNGKETAGLLAAIFRREHSEGRQVSIRGEKGTMSIAERQQFIVEGLPNISATLAQRLLSHFESVHAVINATVDELCKVRGIGRVTAEDIVRVLHEPYFGKNRKDDKKGDDRSEGGNENTANPK